MLGLFVKFLDRNRRDYGFVGAGIGGLAGGTGEWYSDLFLKTLLGGVVSEVTGDKFANGARSSAIAFIIQSAVQKIGAGGARHDTDSDNRFAEQDEGEFYTVDKNGRKSQTAKQRAAQFKHHGVKELPVSAGDAAEIKMLMKNEVFQAEVNDVWDSAIKCGCEPTALRVYEIDGVYWLDRIGTGTNGLSVQNIPQVSEFKNWRHVFDWHPHPAGTPVPSLSDVKLSRNYGGTNNVIWFGRNKSAMYKGGSL